ncbi:hypothetical protein Aduo_019371 [Ancylostoma duodenale]
MSFVSSHSGNATLRRSSTVTSATSVAPPANPTPTVQRSASCPSDFTNSLFIPFPNPNPGAPSNMQTLGYLAPLFALVPSMGYAPVANPAPAPVNVAQSGTNRNTMHNTTQNRSGQRDVQEEDMQYLNLGPMPNVRVNEYPFPGVAVPSMQKNLILLYNIRDSDQCYAFRCVRERGDKKVYACIGCFMAEKTYSVSVYVKNCRFALDPVTLAHRCATMSFLEQISTRTKRTVVTSASGRSVYKRQASSSAETLLKLIKKEEEEDEHEVFFIEVVHLFLG